MVLVLNENDVADSFHVELVICNLIFNVNHQVELGYDSVSTSRAEQEPLQMQDFAGAHWATVVDHVGLLNVRDQRLLNLSFFFRL